MKVKLRLRKWEENLLRGGNSIKFPFSWVFHIIRRNEVGLVFKVSKNNTSTIIAGDKNKGKYISSEQVAKY